MSAAYEYSEAAQEISGFGGGYEQACRTMVAAGMEFWNRQAEGFDPKFEVFKEVFGICSEKNSDAEALTKAMMDATFVDESGEERRVGDDCTGAMHQASVGHVLAARRLGWAGYMAAMEEQDEKGEAKHGTDR